MNWKSIHPLAPIVAIIVLGYLFSLGMRHTLTEPVESNSTALLTQAFFAASYPDAKGKPQALGQWQGKTLVVNFWATWCPPCREEMPELSRLQDQYRDRDVIVLGISVDDLQKVGAFAKESPVSYPLLAGDMEAMSLGESLGNDKGALPYTVIIKPDGRVAKAYFGRVNQALLEKTLIPIIQAKQ